MDKIIIVLSIFIMCCSILSAADKNIAKNSEIEVTPILRTEGEVDFQLTTSTYYGAYAPAHCLAIWVCDEYDNFVRTLVRRAWLYIQHLVKWNEMTGGDDTNAIITGASPNVHTTWNVNWDCTDRFGEMIPDGNYKIYAEFTEDNSLLIPVNGPWTVVEFTKGDQPQTITPAGNQFYQDISLEYNPSEPPEPSITITSPSEGVEITELPFALLFELANVSLDSVTINLFINDEFILQHAGETGIPIYNLPSGDIELTLKLFNDQGQPFDPPVEDSVNIIYNPTSNSQESINSIFSRFDNFPNPFNSITNICYSLKKASNVQIEIYNLKGQKVKTFVSHYQSSGDHSVIWNGTNNENESVTSGVYFYKIHTDFGDDMKKCILMKS